MVKWFGNNSPPLRHSVSSSLSFWKNFMVKTLYRHQTRVRDRLYDFCRLPLLLSILPGELLVCALLFIPELGCPASS
jgi:hypothetical protein